MKPEGMSRQEAQALCRKVAAEVKAELVAKGIGDPDVHDEEMRTRWSKQCKQDYPARIVAPKAPPPVVSGYDPDEDDEPSAEEVGMPVMEK